MITERSNNDGTWKLNLLLCLCSVLLMLVLTEVLLRFIGAPTLGSGQWDYREDFKGWEFRDFRGIQIQGEANSLGLRDDEYDTAHTTYRILALGDSFTYGLGLRNENSWPKLTERLLRSRGYHNIEVLNGGRPGTNTAEQYRLFSEFSYQYKPDMVILGFIINDCTGLCSNCGAVEMKRKLDEAVRQDSLTILKYLRAAYLKHTLTKETVKAYTDPYVANLDEFKNCVNSLIGFKRLARELDFSLLVVIYPMLYHLSAPYPFQQAHDIITEHLASAGIPVYDLTSVFYGYVDTDLWLTDSDSHPNAKANEIAAQAVARIILETARDEQKLSRRPPMAGPELN